MFTDTVAGAIAGVRSHARLNELSQDIWKAYGSGLLTDDEAQGLSETLEARRIEVRVLDQTSNRALGVPRVIGASCFPVKRRRTHSPDRARSIERRRRLAAFGPLPPALALRFTTGELAVLQIVADEVRASGFCCLTLGEIAARAGVSVCHARNAIRAAGRDGLLLIEERRRHRAPNLPNRIRIISKEWKAWMERRRSPASGGGGSKKVESTDTVIRTTVNSTSQSSIRPRKREDRISLDTPGPC
ncbi:MAG: hypothetical protein JWN34_2153 [Bryobacterales bacterium]|nr:hypothetical protein [Bryobacterales bacterium]